MTTVDRMARTAQEARPSAKQPKGAATREGAQCRASDHLRTITVRVTQDHIDRGAPEMAEECPLALALEEAGHIDASVHADGAWIDVRPYLLSRRAQTFVKRFDGLAPVEPATFRLRRER